MEATDTITVLDNLAGLKSETDVDVNAFLQTPSPSSLVRTPLVHALDDILQLDSVKIKTANDAFLDRLIKTANLEATTQLNVQSDVPIDNSLFTSEPLPTESAVAASFLHRIAQDIVGNNRALSEHAEENVSYGDGFNSYEMSNYPLSETQQPILTPDAFFQSAALPSFTEHIPVTGVTEKNIDAYYRLFIEAFHSFRNQNTGCAFDHVVRFAAKPKYQKKTFTLHMLYLVAKEHKSLKHAPSWVITTFLI